MSRGFLDFESTLEFLSLAPAGGAEPSAAEGGAEAAGARDSFVGGALSELSRRLWPQPRPAAEEPDTALDA